MTQFDENTLHSLATRFRYALERNANSEYSPVSMCVHTTLLLSIHIHKRFPDLNVPVYWVKASTDLRRKIKTGHSWLEVGGILVDITMDQFNSDERAEFSADINANAPYLTAYSCDPSNSIHSKLFKSHEYTEIEKDLSQFDIHQHGMLISELSDLEEYL
jgi:hypothetical protein